MGKYKDKFIDAGITNLYQIEEVTQSDLEGMKIPLGHKLKIMKKVREVHEKTHPVEKIIKVSEGIATEAPVQNSLLDGEFDEEANKREFQAALVEWRNAGSKQDNKKKVHFEESKNQEHLIEAREDDEAIEQPKKKKPTQSSLAFLNIDKSKSSFLLTQCGDEWNPSGMLTWDETGTEPMTADTNAAPLREMSEKDSCWTCLKIVAKSELFYDVQTSKNFCSDSCKDKHYQESLYPCSQPNCEERFEKPEGVLRLAKWFCTPNCADEYAAEYQRMQDEMMAEIQDL